MSSEKNKKEQQEEAFAWIRDLRWKQRDGKSSSLIWVQIRWVGRLGQL